MLDQALGPGAPYEITSPVISISLYPTWSPTTLLQQQALYKCVLSLYSLSVTASILCSMAKPKAVSDLIQLVGQTGTASQLSEMPAGVSDRPGAPFEAAVPNLGCTLEAQWNLVIIPVPKPHPRTFRSESLGMEPLFINLPIIQHKLK